MPGSKGPAGTSPAAPAQGRAPSAGFRHAAFLFRARVCFKTRQKRSRESGGAVPAVPAVPGARTKACALIHDPRWLKRRVCGAPQLRALPEPAGGGGGAGAAGGEGAAARSSRGFEGAQGTASRGPPARLSQGAQRSRGLSPGESSFPEGCAPRPQKRRGERGLQPLSKLFLSHLFRAVPLGCPLRLDERSGKNRESRAEDIWIRILFRHLPCQPC